MLYSYGTRGYVRGKPQHTYYLRHVQPATPLSKNMYVKRFIRSHILAFFVLNKHCFNIFTAIVINLLVKILAKIYFIHDRKLRPLAIEFVLVVLIMFIFLYWMVVSDYESVKHNLVIFSLSNNIVFSLAIDSTKAKQFNNKRKANGSRKCLQRK